jgi:hypothetical protein
VGRWIIPALVLGLSSCARWPSLEPVRNERGDWNDAFRQAKVIVVGRVLSVETGPGRLMRARVTVENVLEGEQSEGPAEVYGYLDKRAIVPRERYVFFLLREHGVLRTVWDYRPSAIAVASGLHRAVPLPERTAAERVSALLLTPGDGMNTTEFTRDIATAVAFSITHIGRWQTAKFLKQLAADARPAVGESACRQLTAWYWGQDACWDQLVADTHGRGTAVSRADERERRARTADPDRWWKRMSAARPPAELLDELRLLTAHKDPRVRARYCRFLRAHYPDERDCGCGDPAVVSAGQSSI